LWNLAYDRVLRSALPVGCRLLCYADDTLILARGENWWSARNAANVAVDTVVRSIRAMGLEVAPQKTEAMFFYSKNTGVPSPTQIWVGDVRVPVGPLKYLDLTLDGFEEHFRNVTPKADRMAASLSRLLPNVGGPSVKVRRLYAHNVQLVSLYEAPVWAEVAGASRSIKTLLHRSQRRLAITRSYRTVSFAATTALAGLLPAEIQAASYADVYWRTRAPDRIG